MAMIIAVSKDSRDILYDLGTADSIRVGADVVLTGGVNAPGIRGLGSNQSVLVSGHISTSISAVQIGDAPDDTGARLIVGATGYIAADAGLGHGTVEINSKDFEIVNRGMVTGNVAMVLTNGGGGTSTIENSGTILGTFAAIDRLGAADGSDGRVVLTNTGLIAGTSWSYAAGGAAGASEVDVIRNIGVMRGDIFLGDGNDIYDGRGGGRVFGTVMGSVGNDRFIAGAARDVFDGGEGTDILDFRNGGAVKLALDESFANGGAAAGDRYVGFEEVQGSQRGADVLRGNAAGNILFGNGGNDRLGGAAGSDALIGGAGRDTLTGGAGSDVFIFLRPGDGADVITDFTRVVEAGGSDGLRIDASNFGIGGDDPRGDPLPERAFHSGRTNQAQDRSDRLVFRTSDETLWFDRDGKGGEGPVLIADFSDGVRLVAAEFVLI
jgi:Ca2+-binding RTX toxin-like protein